MSWLKKIGQLLLQGIIIAEGVAPVIAQNVPASAGTVAKVGDDLAILQNIIVQAEAMGQALGLPGADKLRAAAPMVAQMIVSSSILANHKIADQALFYQGSTKIADGMADVLNSLKDNTDSTTQSKAA